MAAMELPARADASDLDQALPRQRTGGRARPALRLILFDLGDTLESGEQLRPGALTTLRAIEKLGDVAHVALLSDVEQPASARDESRIRHEYEELLGRLGIRAFFEPLARWITLSSEVGVRKPAPATFRRAMRKAGADLGFGDVMFITENEGHVRRARELGMRAVQVPGPGGPAAGADITGLEELIGVVEQFVSGREGEGPAAATGEQDGATIHLAVLAPAGASDEAGGSIGHRVRLGALSVQIDTEPIGTDLIDTELTGPQASSDARGAPRSLDRLHLVVQNGRTFQQEHPDVPVLADQGRYLVVDLDPATARELDGPDQVCFSVLPLPLNTTVFARAVAEPVAEQPWIRELVDRVAAGRFRMDLDKLVAFGSRYSTSSAYRAAATATRDELAAQGYAAVLVPITVQGRQSWNVVADHPGSGPQPRPVVLVTAHLDSINLAGGPQAMAPGADDNASGCAGLLTFARVFGTHPGAADLRLILFGGEEQGLFGSRQYVAGLDPAERARIAAVVNMDMIGTLTTQRPTVLIEGAAVSRPVMDGLSAAAATYTSLIVQTSLHPYNSDHVPFLDAAIPAVLTIEGADGANDRVHTDQDLARFVDDELAVQILRMNVAFVAEQLGRAGDPG